MMMVFLRKWGRASLSLFLISALLFSTMAVAFGAADTKGHWAEEAINTFEGRKIIEGYPDGSFKPDKAVTRAEFVTLLNRAAGIAPAAGGGGLSYTDVKAGDWFLGQVSAAAAKGYITGYPDHTFKPNQPVTRQEAATMLAKLLELQGSMKNPPLSFTDADRIGTWAEDAVAVTVNERLFQGYPDRSFHPEQRITRAETAAILQRSLPLIQNLQLVKKVNSGEDVAGTLSLGNDGATVGPEGKQATIHGNVVVTGEGEPNTSYPIDPPGSVSIIEVPAKVGGDVYATLKNEIDQGDVTTLTFEGNNFIGGKEKIDPGVRIFGPGASNAQDLEPEYIATDGTFAYILSKRITPSPFSI